MYPPTRPHNYEGGWPLASSLPYRFIFPLTVYGQCIYIV